MKKNLFVLHVDDYRPDLCKYTLPTIKAYAERHGYEYREITRRLFPEWPVTYEKLQVYVLGAGAYWNLLVDADFMLHPNLPDFSTMIHPKFVGMHYGFDANIFFENDVYFERDGRNIGIAGGFVLTSNLTHDLWKPLETKGDDIYTRDFWLDKTKRKFIIDEYCISRNLARFGLKNHGLEFDVEIAKMMVHIGNEEQTPEQKALGVERAKKLYTEWFSDCNISSR